MNRRRRGELRRFLGQRDYRILMQSDKRSDPPELPCIVERLVRAIEAEAWGRPIDHTYGKPYWVTK